MRSHPFDAVSGALGLIAVAIGALVAFNGIHSIDTGWWIAVGALVLGLGLVPWTWSRRSTSDDDVEAATAVVDPSDPPGLRL